jgi:hypothetical protein
MKRIVTAAVLGLAFCSPALAQDDRAPLGPLLGGIIQERDVTLVFDYMRDALKAAVEGREARPPEELSQRAEAIGDELKSRGAAAARAAIDAIEGAVRERLGEAQRVPPTGSRQAI